MNTALITGIAGQDGAYLAHFLLSRGYRVIGTSRDAQADSHQNLVALGIEGQISVESMALNDFRLRRSDRMKSTTWQGNRQSAFPLSNQLKLWKASPQARSICWRAYAFSTHRYACTARDRANVLGTLVRRRPTKARPFVREAPTLWPRLALQTW